MEKLIMQSELNVVRTANGWKLVVEEQGSTKSFYYEKGDKRDLVCREEIAA
jgi:hypothetical protein